MSKFNIDKIEIVEPPMELLTKRSSRFKLGCFTGCAVVILIIIGGLVTLRLYVGPGVKTLRNVPDNFPKDIPVYDQDAINSITYIPGRYKIRGLKVAAVFPKLIFSPLLLSTQSDIDATTTPDKDQTQTRSLSQIWSLLKSPTTEENRDTIQIEWRDANVEPGYMMNYYYSELRKKNYLTTDEIWSGSSRGFKFNSKQDIEGSFVANKSDDNSIGTGYAKLIVNLPKQ